jgi:hypothetical protein
MRKNVEEMFLWKTVDAKIKPEEESAKIWEMGDGKRPRARRSA